MSPVTALSYVTVTGTYSRQDGSAAEGLVEFYTDVQLINTTTNAVVVPGTIRANLVAGAFSVSLPCTDDADFAPVNWTWRCREIVDDAIRQFDFLLPASPSAVDIADITPTNPASVFTNFVELVQDIIGAMTGFGGTGLGYTYNDAGNLVALVVNVDGTTIEISSDALQLKDGGVSTAKLANLGTTAAKIAAGVLPTVAYKSADQTVSSTSLADDTHLTFAMLANTDYFFEARLFVIPAATSTGYRVALNGPASPTAVRYTAVGLVDYTTGGWAGDGASAYETQAVSLSCASTTLPTVIQIDAYISNGANAGNLVVRIAAEVAASITYKKGSWGRLTKVT